MAFGDQFLARAGFAGDQDGGAAGRHLAHQVQHPHHPLALADDVREAVALLQRALAAACSRAPAGASAMMRSISISSLSFSQGFWKIVRGAGLQRIDRHLRRAVSRDHEDRRLAVALPRRRAARPCPNGPASSGPAARGRSSRPRIAASPSAAFCARSTRVPALIHEQRFQAFPDVRLVVDYENLSFCELGIFELRSQAFTAFLANGNSRRNRVPSPGWLSTSITPLCSRTIP